MQRKVKQGQIGKSIEPVIRVGGLVKRFGEVEAVSGIDFEVHRGELFGFLGPNGAGKTTTVRMLTGVIEPSEGTAVVAGHDVLRNSTAARRHIGVVPEEANVYVDLTVWQNVTFMAQLHGIPRSRRNERGEELLGLFSLSDRRNQKGRALSKGLKQRLMLCMALIGDPMILFLDEPTAGLDVASAKLIRSLLARMHREGLTIFLTTHNMEEAAELCSRVAIINHGRIAAIDTPNALQGTIEARRSVEVTFAGQSLESSDLTGLDQHCEVVASNNGFRIFTPRPGKVAQQIALIASKKNVEIDTIRTLAPSLEDVFLEITGGNKPVSDCREKSVNG